MEDNLGPKPGQGYCHSNYARIVVNDIAIATYEPELDCPATICTLEDKFTVAHNKNTSTLFFKAEQITRNFKFYHPGTDVIGKHYKVRSVEHPNLFRHYTVCNAMHPKAY